MRWAAICVEIVRRGQKSGRPLTPKRPAFAFLVTPKLPLGGRSVKLDGKNKYVFSAAGQLEVCDLRAPSHSAFTITNLHSIKVSTFRKVHWWLPGAWLRVWGADAFSFLQGQFTNDLRQLESEDVVYGLWLSLKGKIMADSFVLRGRGPDEFWLASYESAGSAIRERLEGYIIADDVMVEDVSGAWAGVTVFADNEGGLAAPAPGLDCFVFPGRRFRGGHVEWIFRREQRAAIEPVLGSRSGLDVDAMELLRIPAGIPAVPRDAGAADLPGEAGLDAEAISYAKGCYLGQEVMARLKSIGQVRRRLLRVRGPAADLPRTLPAPLFSGTRPVGELRSAARDAEEFVGLAMLTLMHIQPGRPLAFAPEAPPAIAVCDAP